MKRERGGEVEGRWWLGRHASSSESSSSPEPPSHAAEPRGNQSAVIALATARLSNKCNLEESREVETRREEERRP